MKGVSGINFQHQQVEKTLSFDSKTTFHPASQFLIKKSQKSAHTSSVESLRNNGVESISKNCFKIEGDYLPHFPLYTICKCKCRLPQQRLNSGICSFTAKNLDPNGDSLIRNTGSKILILGGNNGRRITENTPDVLYSNCLLFEYDYGREEFVQDFELNLNQPKDCISAVLVDQKYIYAFFGRIPNPEFREDEQEILSEKFKDIKPNKKYSYSKTIERWDTTSSENKFELIEVEFSDRVECILNPLIVEIKALGQNQFLIFGGVRGNHVPSNQICVVNNTTESFNNKTKANLELYIEEEKLSSKIKFITPCSFPCKDIIRDKNTIYTIGFDVAGRPWVICIDKSPSLSVAQKIIIS